MSKEISSDGESKLTSLIQVYAPIELRAVASELADQAGVPLSEFVVRALAQYVKRPDLATVPRKVPGRRRKELAAK